MNRKTILAATVVVTLTGCAGRPPAPIAIAQPQDQTADCDALQREQGTIPGAIARLQKEQGAKQWQNAAAISAGAILFWPALAGMDWQDAAGKEIEALNQRNRHLGKLVVERCAIK